MIVSAKPSVSNSYDSLGNYLSSSEKFTKVRVFCVTGSVFIGDSNMNTGNDAGHRLTSGESLFLEFDFRDDPASNLFLGTSSSGTFSILAY
jgi:hypothetical protein